jgi:APA family basic amino acid/polyamine antiporter
MLRRVPDSDEPEGLRRVLGPFDATAVVIGAIVGVGIFFTPGRVAALAGDLALWTWALGGFIALLGALTFAEIGGMYPRTGAQYAALRDAYGPAVGFLYVVCNATAIQAGAIAIIALIAVQNAATALTGGELSPFAAPFAAIGLTVLIAGANIRDVRAGAHIQNITTAAKLLALIAVVLVGVSFTGEPAHHPGRSSPPARSSRSPPASCRSCSRSGAGSRPCGSAARSATPRATSHGRSSAASVWSC